MLKKMYLVFILLAFQSLVFALSDNEKAIEYFKGKEGTVREKKGYVYLVDLSAENYINDKDLQYIVNFSNLEIAHLSNTSITSNGLKYFSNMIKLKALSLDNTRVDDSGMKYLKRLESLQQLDLVNTKVTDIGIQELSGLENLRMLKLRGSKVTQKGIDKLKKKLPDCYITLETDEEIQ